MKLSPTPHADTYGLDLTEPDRGSSESDDRPPFDLEAVKPRAVDMRKLWASPARTCIECLGV